MHTYTCETRDNRYQVESKLKNKSMENRKIKGTKRANEKC